MPTRPSTQPFLIVVYGELAGFVCIDDEVTHPEANFNIGYFFVNRRFRGAGVGSAVVAQLLERLPGYWQIFHINENLPASAFWKKVIPLVTSGNFSAHSEHIEDHDCTLYKFPHAACLGQVTNLLPQLILQEN
jgi:predicted acetyltransferase